MPDIISSFFELFTHRGERRDAENEVFGSINIWSEWLTGISAYLKKNAVIKPTKFYVLYLNDGASYLFDQLASAGITTYRLQISRLDLIGLLRDWSTRSLKRVKIPYAWRILNITEIDLTHLFPVRTRYGDSDGEEKVFMSAIILDIIMYASIFYILYKVLILIGFGDSLRVASHATSLFMGYKTRRFQSYVEDKLESFDVKFHEIQSYLEMIDFSTPDKIDHDILHIKAQLLDLLSRKYPDFDYAHIERLISEIPEIDLSAIERLDNFVSEAGVLNSWIMEQILLFKRKLAIL